MIFRCDLQPQYEAYKTEIDRAVTGVLSSGRYTLAEEGARFEEEFARYCGVKHAVAVGSGADALILSLKALAVGPGDEVITTPFTAIPTVSAILAAGAKPVFVDIRPDTFLMDLDQVKQALSPRTKAVVPVHIFGNMVDVPRLKSIVGDKIYIVEDAAQAHGSTFQGMSAGSMGNCGAFSFYPTKNLGAYGDGGMVVTNDGSLAEHLKLLRTYGMIDKDHIVINGFNSRLDEIQAAILRVKLRYLDEMNQKRQVIAERYRSTCPSDYLEWQKISDNSANNYHVLVAKVESGRDEFIQYLNQQSIQTNIYYVMPVYQQKANEFLGVSPGEHPQVEELCQQVIALPMYPELKPDVLDYIINTVNCFHKEHYDRSRR